jgi:ubiquinone/menaquinone biosynthesis C-methylase UbiE
MDSRNHWEKVYTTRSETEVSWYQPEATLSLSLIRRALSDRSAAVIDVGGGASTLVDGLLADGYTRVTVLDVSSSALARASARLGPVGDRVTWLEANILHARLPDSEFDLWHDRAAFHFLTELVDRRRYVDQMFGAVRVGGQVVLATFAGNGPSRCSGLEVVRYEPPDLQAQLGPAFQLLESHREDHLTPGGAGQAFVYCLFRKVHGG